MFTVLNLYVSAMDWWNGLEPYKRGYYQGYILFEVVAAVVSGLLTAPAGGSGAAVILARHAPKFGMVLKKLRAGLTRLANAAGDSLGPLRNVIDDLLTRITGAKAGGWCFVAGTMIMTAQGAVPIEQIREGDLVWSAHEETGKVGLAPVMELYRNEAEEIWTVRYAGNEDGAPVRELKCTGEHPFWSETDQRFVPANELIPGGELRLFGGESARVVRVTPRRGPPGERTRVYNFAVAGHHTYYAGEDGVWVHNVCPEGLDKLTTRYLSILQNGNKTKPEAVAEVFDWMRRDGGFCEEDFQQTAEYLFSRGIDDVADTLLRSNPNSYLTHRELRSLRASIGPIGNELNSHHLLQQALARDVMGISNTDDIIAVPLTPRWHLGYIKGAENMTQLPGEAVNISARIYLELDRIGASRTNPSVQQIWQAHKAVYLRLDREDWAKAIYSAYFNGRGIAY